MGTRVQRGLRSRCAPQRRKLLVEVLESRTLLALMAGGEAPGDPDYAPSEILVRFRPEALPVSAAALPSAVSLEPLSLVPGLYNIYLGAGVSVAEALAVYNSRPDVQYAEANYAESMDAIPDDSQFGDLWGLNNTGQSVGTVDADIDAPEAWNITTGSSAIVVGVIDTGVDYNHPDLYENIWINQAEIPVSRKQNLVDIDGDGLITYRDLNDPRNQGPGKITDINGDGRIDGSDLLAPLKIDASGQDTGLGGWAEGADADQNGYVDDLVGYNFLSKSNDPMDDHLHGTHVAGTIGAIGNNGLGVAGVNWSVQIMPLKFLSAGGSGRSSGAIAAINYAVMMKSRGVNIKLTSNSWGSRLPIPSQAMQDAIAATQDAGMLFIAAAGNRGRNADVLPTYPAAYALDNIISVAASDRNDAKASFSNYGATSVDLAAPGVDILSTFPTETTFAMGSRDWSPNYGTVSGTSMATPHVAAVAALAWSVRPDATYQEIRSAILNGVDPISDFRVDGPTPVATGGRLNALGTLKQLGLFVAGTTPAEGDVVSTPPTTFDVNFSFPIDPASLQPSDLTIDGVPADTVSLSADKLTATFTYSASPVTVEGLQTLHMAQGAVVLEANPAEALFEFTGTFYYDALPMQVLSTAPAADGVFTLLGPLTFDVNFNEAVDPTSLEASDLVLTGIAGATVTDVKLVNDNKTARFTLDGVASEGALNISLAAGTLTDSFGNPNPATFVQAYATDVGTSPLAAPFAEVLPFGSHIERRTASGLVNWAGDTDSFTLAASAGQTISVVVVPQSIGLAPSVELRDPTGNLLASTSAAPARVAYLQTVSAATSGTYTITVGGASATSGGYRIAVTLNAALETETNDFTTNDTLPAAQNIDASAIALGAGAARLAVLGTVGTLPTKSNEDFESGELPLSLTTYSSNDDGQIVLTAPEATGNSSQFALWMDTNTLLGEVMNEAVYSVNLAGVTQANLSFSYVRAGFIREDEAYGDNPDELPADFTGHFDGDGVAISDDGEHWRTVLSAPLNLSWETATIDLAAAAAAAGMTLGADFQIKFQQYGNWPHYIFGFENPLGGRAYDDIQVWLPDAQDTYQLTLAAGDLLTVAAKSLTGGPISFQLLDGSGAIKASGATGPANADQALADNFTVPASGSYYLAVRGPTGAAYALVATTNAAPPSFQKGADQVVLDDSGPNSLPWATAISPGALDELAPALSFVVVVDKPALFAAGPAIDSAGQLTFTPAVNHSGVATVAVLLRDDGETANGGVDRSAPQAFTITVDKLHPWNNGINALDVTGSGGQPDGIVSSADALAIINYLNAFGAGPVPPGAAPGGPFYDVTGDGSVAPNDALAVINHINAFGGGGPGPEGEGEALAAASAIAAPPSSPFPPPDLFALLALDVASQRKRRRF